MSDVIPFPGKAEREGNGAREALADIKAHGHVSPGCWEDWLLLELAARGFKVVPMEDGDAA